MLHTVLALLVLAAAEPPATAPAACASPAEPATLADLSASTDASAQLIVSAAFLLKLGKTDETAARHAREPCPLGDITAAGRTWTLASGDKAFVRRAVSTDRTAPVAFVYPFAQMLDLLEAAKTHGPQPRSRYLFATAKGDTATLWGAYETLPSDAQLTTDLDAAVSGRTKPRALIDLRSGKINLIVSK